MSDTQPKNKQHTAFHAKYRPGSFDEIIGHEVHVTRLRGMVKSGDYPSTILFCGPTSVGKTTLARAFAAEINGKPVEQQAQDYMEINGTDQRSIDDMRNLIQVSKFKPSGKKRIIVIDEAQGVLGNAPAAAALLKSLEEASKTDTIWILCSMEPSKFGNGNGKAIATRCTQFVLAPPSPSDLYKQAVRIAKAERMRYLDKETLKEIVKSAGSEMRTLANLLQSVKDYYTGLEDKPESLDASVIASVVASSESADDALVPKVVVAVLAGQYGEVQKNLLYVADGFQFANKLLWAASFLLNNTVLKGARHPKVWFTPTNKAIMDGLKEAEIKPTLGQLAAFQASLVEMKFKVQTFAVGEVELMSATLYRIVKELHSPK